ncbi:hypothetical protein F5148DRAFT_1225553, partial [Russula earlei]
PVWMLCIDCLWEHLAMAKAARPTHSQRSPYELGRMTATPKLCVVNSHRCSCQFLHVHPTNVRSPPAPSLHPSSRRFSVLLSPFVTRRRH